MLTFFCGVLIGAAAVLAVGTIAIRREVELDRAALDRR